MALAEQAKVLRFFAADLTLYSSYEEARLAVERSDPVPLRVRSFPYETPGLIVFVALMLEPTAVGSEHRLALEWVGYDGEVEAEREERLAVPENAVVSGPFPVSLAVTFPALRFPAPGTCEARLALDGDTVEVLPVEVCAAAGER